MKSIREIAEKLARDYAGYWGRERADAVLVKLVEQVLRDRDERAATIIEDHRAQDVCNDNCWTTIKAAIRNED